MGEKVCDVVNVCFRIINLIRAITVNIRIFKVLCDKMGSAGSGHTRFANQLSHTY